MSVCCCLRPKCDYQIVVETLVCWFEFFNVGTLLEFFNVGTLLKVSRSFVGFLVMSSWPLIAFSIAGNCVSLQSCM